MEEQFMIKGMPTGIRFPEDAEEKKEYGIDPRLLVWIKNNVEGDRKSTRLNSSH